MLLPIWFLTMKNKTLSLTALLISAAFTVLPASAQNMDPDRTDIDISRLRELTGNAIKQVREGKDNPSESANQSGNPQQGKGLEIIQGVENSFSKAKNNSNIQAIVDANVKATQQAAEATIKAEEKKVREFLGLPQAKDKADNQLYILVSTSMPDSLIKSYIRDAYWTGATLIYKGLKKDQTIAQFIRENIEPLIAGKGPTATATIDPRLFDIFEVSAVPAIVVGPSESKISCTPLEPEDSSSKCQPLGSSDYFKITGAVTMTYALDQFALNGAENVAIYQQALSRGVNFGINTSKDQTDFQGQWEMVITPAQLRTAEKEANEQGLEAYVIDGRIYTGPKGLKNPDLNSKTVNEFIADGYQ